MVLVIIIMMAWVVILGPSLIKRRARSGGDQSISHFHRQLRILEHSAPEPIVTPAYRLRAVDGTDRPSGITYPTAGAPPVLTVVGAKELPKAALAFLGEPDPSIAAVVPAANSSTARAGYGRPASQFVDYADYQDYQDDQDDQSYDDEYEQSYDESYDESYESRRAVHAGSDLGVRGADAFARNQSRRRRRDILVVLAGIFATTFLVGLLAGTSFAWMLCAVDGVVLAAYVGLMVYLKRMAMEREAKLHYLDPFADGRMGRTSAVPSYVGGRYAHPSNGQAVAR